MWLPACFTQASQWRVSFLAGYSSLMEVARGLPAQCSCSYPPCASPLPFKHRWGPALRQPLPWRRHRRRQGAQAEQGDGRGGGLDSSREVAVPWEQRPVNELAQLRESWLFSWVRLRNFSAQQGSPALVVRSRPEHRTVAKGVRALFTCAYLPLLLGSSVLTKADTVHCAQATLSLPEYIKRVCPRFKLQICLIALQWPQSAPQHPPHASSGACQR